MSYFEWNSNLDLGVDSMNDEHKHLIDLMNKLHALNESKSPHATLLRAVDDLAGYTVKHFADEEAFMASVNFPGLATHKLIHQQLLQQLSEQRDAFAQAGGTVPDAFFKFLKHWLSAHIKGIDMKYGRHANANAA